MTDAEVKSRTDGICLRRSLFHNQVRKVATKRHPYTEQPSVRRKAAVPAKAPGHAKIYFADFAIVRCSAAIARYS